LQKELDTANRKTEQGNVRHRDDVQKLQAQVGYLRQQVGVLEGKLDALRTERAMPMKRCRRVINATNWRCR
jgi:cell division protein FtsB